MKKKILLITLFVFIILGFISLIVFLNVRISPDYYGTFTRYYYFKGEETKVSYIIKPLSIIKINKSKNNSDGTETKEKLKYYKKGVDLVIHDDDRDEYMILDDNHLYISTSKEYDFDKNHKIYYWKENNENSIDEELLNKSEYYESTIEHIVNNWSRSEAASDYNFKHEFYMYDMDEETENTDLNVYKVVKDVANGELEFDFDKKTKKVKSISFYGTIMYPSNLKDIKLMEPEDVYDVKAVILALIYMFSEEDYISIDSNDSSARKYSSYLEFLRLMLNSEDDSKYSNGYSYKLNDDKYDIWYDSKIDISGNFISGYQSFNFYIN